MTREEALLYMRIGGTVKHPKLPGKTLGIINGRVRVRQNGLGFEYSFRTEEIFKDGWKVVSVDYHL
ncbi:hypothetical protein vBKpPHS106_94 [Klebsiella phage VB_KpP_HS106]|nr:hypothetical protein vBKpPHS106_94 [Klebsiella phage VB_KpP_HS106]